MFKKYFFSLPIFTLFCLSGFGQLPYNLIDNRQHKYCEPCRQAIEDKPNEVLFGIQINANGDIYFSMSNEEWFQKIFKSNSYGVSIDLVPKDIYSCGRSDEERDFSLPKGTMTLPVYKADLIKNRLDLSKGHIFVKVGKVPPKLMSKQLEGNLVIVNGNFICFYTNFVNIDRNVWQLLPMGLFTDSLIRDADVGSDSLKGFFNYSKKLQLEVPFLKGASTFSNEYLQKLYDSLELKNYNVRKADIRVYSSVEGSSKTNDNLMKLRAESMIKALKVYQPALQNIHVTAAENWLEFFGDIEGSKFEEMNELSKVEVKQKLSDQQLAAEIEAILSKHRKVVLTLYLESKSPDVTIANTSILSDFKMAVSEKNIPKAKSIQKEIAERIMDNKLPIDYINKVEVPQSKEFSSLLNDREVYRYLLKATSEYEALDNFLALRKLDSSNGQLNYNICALRFFIWRFSADSIGPKLLLKEINALPKQGINETLVRRLMINYNIMKCEEQMAADNYAAKDSSLAQIKTIYETVVLDDADVFSLAKYFANYAHNDWSEEIVAPRVAKIDVNEDLVFYYVNLLFFQPGSYDSDNFHKAMLNAINLNRERFCSFFLPNDKGGASMQLLDYDEIKSMYCDVCR